MPKRIVYMDPYGYTIEAVGYSLEEILRREYTPKFRYAKPIERQLALIWISRRRIDGWYYFGFELPREVEPEILRLPEPIRRDAIILSRFKLDCLLETRAEYIIVEIKDRLQSTSISQPLFYEQLFKQYFKPTKPTRKLLVAGQAVSEAVSVAKRLGIEVDVLDVPVPRKPAEQLLYALRA